MQRVKQTVTDAELAHALRGWTVAGLPDELDALLLQVAGRLEARGAPPYGVKNNPDCEGCIFTQSGMGSYPCWGEPGKPGGCRMLTGGRENFYTCRKYPGEDAS